MEQNSFVSQANFEFLQSYSSHHTTGSLNDFANNWIVLVWRPSLNSLAWHTSLHVIWPPWFCQFIKLLPLSPPISLLIKECTELRTPRQFPALLPCRSSLSNMPSLGLGPEEPFSWTLGVPTSISQIRVSILYSLPEPWSPSNITLVP